MTEEFLIVPFYGDFTIYRTSDGVILSSGTGGPQIAPQDHTVLYGHAYDNLEWRIDPDTLEAYPFQAPKNNQEIQDDIIRERTRRLAQGFSYDFGDARGIHHIGTTETDMAGWRDVNDAAFKSMARGLATKLIDITTDTGPIQVTAEEWLDVLDAAEDFRQPIWQASFYLQSLTPLPQDAANPAHWPEED